MLKDDVAFNQGRGDPSLLWVAPLAICSYDNMVNSLVMQRGCLIDLATAIILTKDLPTLPLVLLFLLQPLPGKTAL